MNLKDISGRMLPPVPWQEGEKIPWNDPRFSKRMLKEHLNQDHDMASRNFKLIDKQVNCISDQFLSKVPSNILDLGCGPGLYSERFARLGHTCRGIDFSPASIDYANTQNEKNQLNLTYELADLRTADFGTNQDLVLFIFGEFNVFKVPDARLLLQKSWQSMNEGAVIVVELSTFDAIRREGLRTATWYSRDSGLWSDKPYIVLEEHYWDDIGTTTTRYFILDAETGELSRYSSTSCAYSEDDLGGLFRETGFSSIQIIESLANDQSDHQEGLQVITARK